MYRLLFRLVSIGRFTSIILKYTSFSGTGLNPITQLLYQCSLAAILGCSYAAKYPLYRRIIGGRYSKWVTIACVRLALDIYKRKSSHQPFLRVGTSQRQ